METYEVYGENKAFEVLSFDGVKYAAFLFTISNNISPRCCPTHEVVEQFVSFRGESASHGLYLHSAEVLLFGIAGGSGTVYGPICSPSKATLRKFRYDIAVTR